VKILVLSNKFPYPLKDGGAIATFNLIKGLIYQGNKLTLLTLNTKKHYFPVQNFPVNEVQGLEIHSVALDTTPRIIPALKNLLFSAKPYIAERFYSSEFLLKLADLLKNNQFDIVQIEGLYMLQYIPEIRANSHAVISYRAHNIEHEIWQYLAKNKKNPLIKFYLSKLSKNIRKFEQQIINQYDALLPISEKDNDFFQKNGNSKPVLVCPAGFDTDNFKPYNKIVQSPKLYFIGSLEWQPNREALLWFIENCRSSLKKLHPELKLYIAGRNAPPAFQEKIKFKDIIFRGEVENAYEFISDKSIMIVPLLSGSGMRIKIIEAFFMQKAVVSTSLGAAGTKSSDNKHLLIAENASEFIQKISKLINDQNFYNSIVKNAYILAKEHFDNKNIALNVSGFYKKMLNNKR
jgi:glycosyltransferase involved in cell wall biosynthesis